VFFGVPIYFSCSCSLLYGTDIQVNDQYLKNKLKYKFGRYIEKNLIILIHPLPPSVLFPKNIPFYIFPKTVFYLLLKSSGFILLVLLIWLLNSEKLFFFLPFMPSPL